MNNTPNRPTQQSAVNPNPNQNVNPSGTASSGTAAGQQEPVVRRPVTPARAVRRPSTQAAVPTSGSTPTASAPTGQSAAAAPASASSVPTVRRPAQGTSVPASGQNAASPRPVRQPAQPVQRTQNVQNTAQNAAQSAAYRAVPNTAQNTAYRPVQNANAPQNAAPNTNAQAQAAQRGQNVQQTPVSRPAAAQSAHAPIASAQRSPMRTPQTGVSAQTVPTPRQRQAADAPTTQVDLAHRMATADNSATRRMAVTPPAGQKKVSAPASGRDQTAGKGKKKKQMSEGAATLLSVVKAITYIILVIVIAGFLSYYFIRITNDMFAFVKSDEQVEVVIPEYATIHDVSEILADAGVITYPDIFELYAKLNEDDGQFLAGTYEVNGMMNYDELRMAFKEKVVREIVRLTIPEGYTIDEIIDLFLENGIGGTREDWVAAVNDLELYSDFAFVQALIGNTSSNRIYALEGYLFPDTYDFYTDAKASQIVYKLLNRFNNIFKDEFYTRAAELGYTVDEIVILASMIEKETRLYYEFELVSSVFHNRLRNSAAYPCLESDATIMYAIQHDSGARKEQLTHDDLSYDSPYNTYTNQGLPPGPIANPSYQAITCALYPEESTYYYFVTGKTGETVFSSTYAQHQAAVAEARG